jgi:2,4-dienoyl-CoA reductase-like NADH-dependent reductase (Old Yellow Enzyme family)
MVPNVRTDEYGGSIENRCRFFWSFDAIKEVIPQEKYRSVLTPLDGLFGMTMDKDNSNIWVYHQKIKWYNLAYVHLSRAVYWCVSNSLLYRKLLPSLV